MYVVVRSASLPFRVSANITVVTFEINAACSFLKRNWSVFISTIGSQIGFQSSKAESYFLKGPDHHKTWQLLEIMHVAKSLELVHSYAKGALESKAYSICDGYWEWCEQLLDLNFVYLQHMTTTYVHALLILRSGVRKCNSALKQKFLVCSLVANVQYIRISLFLTLWTRSLCQKHCKK